jgi:hypothetical protein
MIWVAWRQFRTQALVTLGLLAALAALALVTGLRLHEAYGAFDGIRCRASARCAIPPLTGLDKPLSSLLGPLLLSIPALIGMFWGAPLLARELESGTWRLAWTQSVTPRRWLSVKFALIGLAALAVAGLASWLVSWWSAPLDVVNMNRLEPSVFDVRGIAPVGYAAFAFALGVAAGAALRRTLPTMAVTLLGFVATRVAFTLWVRPRLLPAREALIPVTQGKGVGFLGGPSSVRPLAGPPPIPNAWITSATLVDRSRHAPGAAQLHALVNRACPTLTAHGAKGPPEGAFTACQRALSDHLRQLVAYQPPSHYWPLQGLETAIFLAAALVLIGGTVWRVGRTAAPASSEGRQTPLSSGDQEQAAVTDLAALRPSR